MLASEALCSKSMISVHLDSVQSLILETSITWPVIFIIKLCLATLLGTTCNMQFMGTMKRQWFPERHCLPRAVRTIVCTYLNPVYYSYWYAMGQDFQKYIRKFGIQVPLCSVWNFKRSWISKHLGIFLSLWNTFERAVCAKTVVAVVLP